MNGLSNVLLGENYVGRSGRFQVETRFLGPRGEGGPNRGSFRRQPLRIYLGLGGCGFRVVATVHHWLGSGAVFHVDAEETGRDHVVRSHVRDNRADVVSYGRGDTWLFRGERARPGRLEVE